MVLDPTMGAPISPYPSMLPDWTDEHEALFQQSIAAQQPVAPDPMLPMDAAAPAQPAITAAPASFGGQEIPGAHPAAPMPPWAAPLPGELPAAPIDAQQPATEPLAIDAISGGTTEPQRDDYVRAESAGKPVARIYSTTADPAPAPDDYLSQDELNDRAASESDAAFVKRQVDHATALKEYQTGRQLEAARMYREQAERDHDDYLRARAIARAETEQLTAEAKELANAKIDNNKWWADRSTGQTIAAFVSAIAGGLAAPYNGGRNDGLAMINNAIEKDIQTQEANLANRRAMLADRRATLADHLQQMRSDRYELERYRIASYQRTINEIATEAQRFDPRGSTAIAYGEVMRGLAAKQAQAIHNAQKERVKLQLEASNADRDERKLQEDIRQAKSAEKRDWARIGQAGKFHKDEMDLAQKKLDAEAEKLRAEGKTKEAEALQKFGVTAPGVLTKDGKPFLAQGSPEAIDKVREQVGAARTIVNLIDQARRIRSGYSSSVKDRDEWQKLRVTWAHLKAQGKNLIGLGALSDSDFELLTEFLGADDPTKSASIAAGVEQARTNVVALANSALQSRAADPSNISFEMPDPMAHGTAQSEHDRQLKSVLEDAPVDRHETQAQREAEREGKVWLSGRAMKQLDQWGEDAKSSDPVIRAPALAALESASKTGRSGVKKLASEKLRAVQEASMPAPSAEAVGPLTSTAQEPPIDQYGLPPEGME